MTTFVSVDDFTGTDQSRIDQAIAAITPTGGTIIFPKRTYTVNNFTLRSHMSIIGNGSTITRVVALNAPLIDIEQNATNVTISGLIFQGNKANEEANNAGAIRCVLNQHLNISHCVFNDILRVAVVIDRCRRVSVSKVSFNRIGKPNSQAGLGGVSLAVTSSKDITIENASTLDNFGEGMSVVESQGIVFRNHTYTNAMVPPVGSDKAITFTQCADFMVEDIEASYMRNAGIEINACNRFKLTNLNLHHNTLYNLMISTFTPNGEVLSTYGEVSNVISQDAGSAIGINIIGSHHMSLNNVRDNKRTRFATSGTAGFESVDVEVKNSSFNAVELTGARNIRLLNNAIMSTAISNTTYSMIDQQNKFEAYFQADLANNGTIDVKVPETASAGTTFFHGTLSIDNTFTASASLQFTARLVHIKMIWDKLYQNIVSTLQGSVTSREFHITGGNNTLTITNVSGVATTLRGRLTGTVAMY